MFHPLVVEVSCVLFLYSVLMCLSSPCVVGSTLAKTSVASLQTREKTREKHSVASPPRVFHSFFLLFVVEATSVFDSVDPTTLGEDKLLDSYAK